MLGCVGLSCLRQELSHEPALLAGASARDFLAHGRNATETGVWSLDDAAVA